MASSRDLDILAWTMLGEAGGEGRDGMADVGHVILNRLETGKYGSSISDVALANKQFSAWNKGEGGNDPQGRYPKSSREFQQARQLAEQVVSGAIPGPPGKPLDYHTPDISPYWASSKDRYGTYTRNGHLFYPSQPVPPGEIPNVVASQTDTTPPQQITGKSNAPTSAASRQVPTNWFTPRLAPGNEQAYTYQIPDQTPTSVVGGLGSLTPDRAPPPLPRPRPSRMDIHPFDPSVNTPRDNGDGTFSTEVTRTVQLPDGKWANVPSLWWGQGSTVRDFGSMDDDQLAGLSTRYEKDSGKAFPRFNSIAEAERAASSRSNAGAGKTGAITSAMPPLPRPRPGMPVVPYEQGRTVASVPAPQRQSLPPLPPSNLAPANLVSTTMDRASNAVDPGLQRALEQRNQRPMIETSMQRTAAAVDPGLQRALEASGVGKPPATRSVASVPASVPAPAAASRPTGPALSRDSVAQAERGSYMARVMPNMRSQVAAAPMPTTAVPNAIPGPNRVAQVSSRLPASQWGVPDALLAETGVIPPAVPDVGVASAMSVIPPMPRPRPVPFSMPTPMGQRPTLPMPRANPFAMPTPVAQRPNPNALRVTVNGAGSYNAPQRAPTPTREQMLAAIRARSRGPTAFGHGGIIDGAVQPIGTLSGRR